LDVIKEEQQIKDRRTLNFRKEENKVKHRKVAILEVNEEEMKNKFDAAFEEKFKSKVDNKTSKDISSKNVGKGTDTPKRFKDSVALDSPTKRKYKTHDGPYQKGNWRTLNIKEIVSQNVLNSNNPGYFMT